jgi:hypothetical protein
MKWINKLGSTFPIVISLLSTPISLHAAEVGPSKGSLVVVGGNMQDETIVKRIIDLAGGPGELLVIIPTAGAARDYDDSFPGLRQFREWLTGLGARMMV